MEMNIYSIMAKYIDNTASELESIMLMKALYESPELRAQFRLASAGMNRIAGRVNFGNLR